MKGETPPVGFPYAIGTVSKSRGFEPVAYFKTNNGLTQYCADRRQKEFDNFPKLFACMYFNGRWDIMQHKYNAKRWREHDRDYAVEVTGVGH